MNFLKIAVASLSFVLAPPASAHAAGPGGKILEASGVTGGVVVHLGCGDAERTVSLHGGDRFLVHGLDTGGAKVARARAHIDSKGLYGKVSAEKYDGRNLPYGDNIVNLVVVDDAADVTAAEIERALVPNGVVLVKADSRLLEGSPLKRAGRAGGRAKYVKPWPDEIDQWTHYLHDASNNAVSSDKRVRRPRHVQWYAGPKRARHHDALASLSAMTSSHGRVFYIFDEGATSIMHRPAHWKLVARDAFNGKLLWKRDIPDWMTHLYNFRAGPKQLPRRLVSVGDSVFVTLGLCAAATRLDAATGETLHTYEGSEKTEELVYHDGMLLALVGDPSILIDKSDACHGYWEMAEFEQPTVDKTIVAYDAKTGKKRWTVAGKHLRHAVPLSLVALGENVFYLDNERLHCLDARTGKERWASPFETEGLFIRSYAPTVVAYRDVILCLKWNRLVAYAIATGKKLWENKGAMGFGSPADLFAIGGKVWTVPLTKSIWRGSRKNRSGVITTGINIPKSEFLNDAKTAVGLDLRTGEITDLLPFAHTQHHHRCHRNKATRDYLLVSHSGIQVVDLKTRTNETHRWVRGLCQYGIMPANGYLYVPPDTCRCYGTGKINGFFALSEKNSWEDIEPAPVTEKGPALARIAAKRDAKPAATGEWPTYRANGARGGAAPCDVPTKPAVTWRAEIGATITAPVIAGGKVFVAERDAYTVHCLHAESGKPAWKYLANGPVDSPPTIYKGLCIFGCGDGSVYCLDAESGRLAWRFKTSKIERRIGHEDRLESPLRIHGSTLVQDDTVYFAAGYSSNLDGGIRLYGVDAFTGEKRCQGSLASGPWGSDGQWGFLADILVSNGTSISMRNAGFSADLKKGKGRSPLVATTGLLESSWFHRMGWQGGGSAGQLVVFDQGRSVSVVNPYTGLKRRRKGKYEQFNQVGHFHQKFARYQEEWFPVGTVLTSGKSRRGTGWSRDLKLQPRAMLLAGERLCLAGWIDAVVVELKTGRPKDPSNPDPRDSVLRIYSGAGKGEQVSELSLPCEPVFDGMAAAYGKLFLSLKNGRIICLGE